VPAKDTLGTRIRTWINCSRGSLHKKQSVCRERTYGKINDFAHYLPQIIEKHTELARFIEAWPGISDEIKQAVIKAMR